MMAFYKASEKFGMECMQLTPAFDIDLFAEPDNEEYNMVGDEMENPFFGTAPAGTQQMTLVSGYNWPTYVLIYIKLKVHFQITIKNLLGVCIFSLHGWVFKSNSEITKN